MNIIRQLRKESGISQKELSKRLKLSQQSISRIENMDSLNTVPGYLLIRFAKIFDVTLDVLIGNDEISIYDKEDDELWQIYKRLDPVNKETLLVMGRRLYDTQAVKK